MNYLKNIINEFGIEKVNTLTKYPSIFTFHKMERGRLTDEINPSVDYLDWYYITEKIDGTNVRIIVGPDDYVVGSRNELLSYSEDIIYNPTLGIVDFFRNHTSEVFKDNVGVYDIYTSLKQIKQVTGEGFFVIYGELFGGNIGKGAKNYGKDAKGFRLFDVAWYSSDTLDILNSPLASISSWREKELDGKLVYGADWFNEQQLDYINFMDRVPNLRLVSLPMGRLSHVYMLNLLQEWVPKTQVALSETALEKSEGFVLRNKDRSTILKVRWEDYEKAVKTKK